MSCAPIAMMQLVDYYAFRKKHISIRDAYNNGKNSKYYFWGWLSTGLQLAFSQLRWCCILQFSIPSCAFLMTPSGTATQQLPCAYSARLHNMC